MKIPVHRPFDRRSAVFGYCSVLSTISGRVCTAAFGSCSVEVRNDQVKQEKAGWSVLIVQLFCWPDIRWKGDRAASMDQEEAEKLLQIIQGKEPGCSAKVVRRFWKRDWVVRVVRQSGTYDYEDVYAYWLAYAMVNTFCRPLGDSPGPLS